MAWHVMVKYDGGGVAVSAFDDLGYYGEGNPQLVRTDTNSMVNYVDWLRKNHPCLGHKRYFLARDEELELFNEP